METKTGYKTSEFFITSILNFIGVGLTTFGLVNPADIDMVLQELAVIVGAIMTIISSAVYVWSRVRLKEATINNEVLPEASKKDDSNWTLG